MCDIFGQHAIHISHAKHLTGHFNAHLQDAIFVFADEAFWAGDKQTEGALKQLITEPTIAIERKGRDVTQARNMTHILMASNSEWVVPAGMDERRFCVLDVSDAHAQDTSYFAALDAELKAGGLEAMLYDLLHHDLSGLDLRRAPSTTALREQKLLSLPPAERWWYSKLQSGCILLDDYHWPLAVAKNALYDDYIVTLGKVGASRRATETELGMLLRRLMPRLSDDRRMVAGKRIQHWVLPSLAECRAAFDAQMRSAMAWEPIEGDEEVRHEAA